jgi:hypothetical protein
MDSFLHKEEKYGNAHTEGDLTPSYLAKKCTRTTQRNGQYENYARPMSYDNGPQSQGMSPPLKSPNTGPSSSRTLDNDRISAIPCHLITGTAEAILKNILDSLEKGPY